MKRQLANGALRPARDQLHFVTSIRDERCRNHRLATPFYAVANGEGQLHIANVPYGRYLLHVWSEGTGPENAEPTARDITIAESSTSLGVIRVPAINGQSLGAQEQVRPRTMRRPLRKTLSITSNRNSERHP